MSERTSEVRETLRRRGIEPGAMPVDEAAAYVGLSPNTFLAEVEAGTMPPPIPLKARRKLWARSALDAKLRGADAPIHAGDAISEAIENYAV